MPFCSIYVVYDRIRCTHDALSCMTMLLICDEYWTREHALSIYTRGYVIQCKLIIKYFGILSQRAGNPCHLFSQAMLHASVQSLLQQYAWHSIYQAIRKSCFDIQSMFDTLHWFSKSRRTGQAGRLPSPLLVWLQFHAKWWNRRGTATSSSWSKPRYSRIFVFYLGASIVSRGSAAGWNICYGAKYPSASGHSPFRLFCGVTRVLQGVPLTRRLCADSIQKKMHWVRSRALAKVPYYVDMLSHLQSMLTVHTQLHLLFAHTCWMSTCFLWEEGNASKRVNPRSSTELKCIWDLLRLGPVHLCGSRVSFDMSSKQIQECVQWGGGQFVDMCKYGLYMFSSWYSNVGMHISSSINRSSKYDRCFYNPRFTSQYKSSEMFKRTELTHWYSSTNQTPELYVSYGRAQCSRLFRWGWRDASLCILRQVYVWSGAQVF